VSRPSAGAGTPPRVLLASLPELSHTLPLVPLAWALRAAGAEVLLASGGDAKAVTSAGLPLVDLAPGRGISEFLKGLDLAALAGSGPGPEHPYATLLPRVENLLTDAHIAELHAMMDDYVQLAVDWQPDLVVYSPMTAGALVAAAKVAVPAVEHGFGFLRTAGFDGLLRALGADLFDRHGVDLPERRLWLDVAPPSVVPGAPHGWPLRYLPYNGGHAVPAWLRTAPSRPRVAVTLGNLLPELQRADGQGLVHRIVRAAAGVAAEFVLAVGSLDTSLLGELPGNVTTIGYTPLTVLLPTCAAVVHHGGAGTTMAALDHGIPQLVIPHALDHALTAELLVKRGAGLAADPTAPGEPSAELLGALVGDPALAAAAAEVQAEMRAMPSPAAVAARLLDLVGR
jgi:8-demethyltetracenomycin C L-rhamnosyltransferase